MLLRTGDLLRLGDLRVNDQWPTPSMLKTTLRLLSTDRFIFHNPSSSIIFVNHILSFFGVVAKWQPDLTYHISTTCLTLPTPNG